VSTEELKMVLDAISQLGASGKEAFVWWMVFSYGTHLLTGLMMLTAVLCVPYMILRAVVRYNRRTDVLGDIAAKLGVEFWSWADHAPGHGLKDIVVALDKKLSS
jgi:hypothetical protein